MRGGVRSRLLQPNITASARLNPALQLRGFMKQNAKHSGPRT